MFAITGSGTKKSMCECPSVCLSGLSDVTHRIGLQDCRIVLRAIFKKDRVLGFLWCFCKCVFSLCCSVLLDDCRWLMSRSRLQDCTITLRAIFWSFLGVIVNVFRVLGSKANNGLLWCFDLSLESGFYLKRLVLLYEWRTLLLVSWIDFLTWFLNTIPWWFIFILVILAPFNRGVLFFFLRQYFW